MSFCHTPTYICGTHTDIHLCRTEELLEAQAATAVAEADAKKSAHGLKKAESEIKHLQKELKDSQARDKDHAVELAAAQSLAKNLQDDINIMSQKASESAAKVEELESALSSTRANAEDKLRALFGAQLKEVSFCLSSLQFLFCLFFSQIVL